MTRAVPPASCRIRVELFVENATPAGILWAIIMPPSNSGRSQIPRSLYNSPRPLSLARPLSSSLSFPPLHFISWIAQPTRHVVHLSLCPAYELYFLVSSGQCISIRPVLIYPTRSSFGYRRQKLSSSVNCACSIICCASFYATVHRKS
jgi:hypothetical protein